jgi:hypothetical protein
VSESSRLEERRFSAGVGRAAARMAVGHHGRAVPDLQRLVAEHPDLNVGSRHAFLATNPALETYGRGLFGLDPRVRDRLT